MTLVPSGSLVSSIQNAVGIPLISHSASTKGYDLFEAYLFGITVDAALSIGMQVRFRDAQGVPAVGLVLRTSPSAISTESAAANPADRFTHAELAIDGVPRLEVHLGIFVRGKSGVSHEADIVVLSVGEAARARALRTDPRVSGAAIVLEAKFYAKNVPLHIGREFLGLGVDFTASTSVLVASSPSKSVHRLLSHRSRPTHLELVPGSNQETELKGRIATRLRDQLALS